MVWNFSATSRLLGQGPPAAQRPLGMSGFHSLGPEPTLYSRVWLSLVMPFVGEGVGEEGAQASLFVHRLFSFYFSIGKVKPFTITEVIFICLVLILSSLVLCFWGCFGMGRVWFHFHASTLVFSLAYSFWFVCLYFPVWMKVVHPVFKSFKEYLNYNSYNYLKSRLKQYLVTWSHIRKINYALTYSIQSFGNVP